MSSISKQIKLEKVNNTRDLGGIRTQDGRCIRDGRLFRSGQLFFASQADIQALTQLGIRCIYDFRTQQERDEKPDPEIGAENIHHPLLRGMVAGISREEEEQKAPGFMEIMADIAKDQANGIRYMEKTYESMISDDYVLARYAEFLERVSRQQEGGVLWHCTAGKDRAGFATVLILTILGVDRETILKDYLATNEFLAPEIEQIMAMLKQNPALDGAEEGIRDFFGAREAYLAAAYRKIEERFGSMERFLRDALHVDEEMTQRMRALYLAEE